ncbi:MAG: sugar ABC transporter ATP-binding protein [Solirubrobacterales bacterium]
MRNVDLDLGKGEIHSLAGGNGSGKSTLIKILAGVVGADSGTIKVGERTVSADQMTPVTAREAGMRFLHQNAPSFPDLTVAENLALESGFIRARSGRIKWRAQRRHATEVLSRYGIEVSPSSRLDSLSVATRTLIAIACVLQDQEEHHSGVLVLDEPTTALPPADVGSFFDALRGYAAAGQTIMFVSHRLEEVLGLADRVTVLRDGERVSVAESASTDEGELATMMIGRKLSRVFPQRTRRVAGAATLLEVRHLTSGPLEDVSFSIAKGEILGVAGLTGSGRTELLQALFGLSPLTRGEIRVEQKSLKPVRPTDAIDAGLAFIPEDRLEEAAFEGMTIKENLSAAVVSSYLRGGRLRKREERDDALRLIEDFGITPGRADAHFLSLSGGNQQKVILARWTRRAPRLLLLDEPTQGVDIGARMEIYALINEIAARGAGVLLVSSDFDELAGLSDRILVLADGRIAHQSEEPLDTTEITKLTNAGARRDG